MLVPVLLASVAGLVAVGLSTASTAAVGAAANACKITQPHSLSASVKTKILFVNKTAGTVKVYWLDYTGKRVYYWTLTPGKSYTQRTFDTNPWVVLTSSGACIGYVIAPKSQYVITGTATAAPPPTTTPPATTFPPRPSWVSQLINDHNLSITTEGTWVDLVTRTYNDCATQSASATPGWSGVENYIVELSGALTPQFLTYTRGLPGWISDLRKLKPTPATATALKNLSAALPLHVQEDNGWTGALAALKAHNCNVFLSSARAAEQSGKPAWKDSVAGTLALAGIYGQAGSVRRDDPYATKI